MFEYYNYFMKSKDVLSLMELGYYQYRKKMIETEEMEKGKEADIENNIRSIKKFSLKIKNV